LVRKADETEMVRIRISTWLLSAAAPAWVGVVAGGYLLMMTHWSTPGDPGEPPGRWPARSALRRDPARANLVMVLHPLCPCSRASLAELARVAAQCQGRVAVHLVFSPPREALGGAAARVRPAVAAVPGAEAVDDTTGAEAALFGAETSGHTLLYDRAGRLVFSGGITASRGHEGDSPGHDAVVARLNGQEVGCARAPVFGCPTRTPAAGDVRAREGTPPDDGPGRTARD
jgi:hypothetical protein